MGTHVQKSSQPPLSRRGSQAGASTVCEGVAADVVELEVVVMGFVVFVVVVVVFLVQEEEVVVVDLGQPCGDH